MKEEPVDVLDEQGNKTGQVLLKSKVHAQGFWHPVIHLWIYNSKGQILLQMRSAKKKVWPDMWDVSVGGHVTAGQTLEEAVVMEAGEELGLKIDPKNIKLIHQSKYEYDMPEGWKNRIFVWSYATKMDVEIEDLNLEEDEVSDARWFSQQEVKDEILDQLTNTQKVTPDIAEDVQIILKQIPKQKQLPKF